MVISSTCFISELCLGLLHPVAIHGRVTSKMGVATKDLEKIMAVHTKGANATIVYTPEKKFCHACPRIPKS